MPDKFELKALGAASIAFAVAVAWYLEWFKEEQTYTVIATGIAFAFSIAITYSSVFKRLKVEFSKEKRFLNLYDVYKENSVLKWSKMPVWFATSEKRSIDLSTIHTPLTLVEQDSDNTLGFEAVLETLIGKHTTSSWVIRGSVGSGKTIFLRQLAIRVLNETGQTSNRKGFWKRSQVKIDSLPVVAIVKLGDLSVAASSEFRGASKIGMGATDTSVTKNDGDWLKQLVQNQLAEAIDRKESDVELFLGQAEQMHLLLLLDGFDEVDSEQRPFVKRAIESFVNSREKCGTQVVMTSRETGFRAAEVDFLEPSIAEGMSDWLLKLLMVSLVKG